MSDRAFYAAYAGEEMTLPNGKTARCKPPEMTTSARMMRLYDGAIRGDGKATEDLMDAFPKLFDDPKAFDGLYPAEFFDAVRDFFTLRRSGPTPEAEPSA